MKNIYVKLLIYAIFTANLQAGSSPNTTPQQSKETRQPSDAELIARAKEFIELNQCLDNRELKEQLKELLNLLRAERAEKHALQQQQKVFREQKQLEQAKLIEEIEKLPWYVKYSLIIAGHTVEWTTRQLWPTMKAIMTNIVAQKLVSEGFGQIDNVTGRLPLFSFRFGEVLTMNKEQRADQEVLRNLHKHPKYRKLMDEIKQFKGELRTFQHIHELQREHEKLSKIKKDIFKYGTSSHIPVEELHSDDEK